MEVSPNGRSIVAENPMTIDDLGCDETSKYSQRLHPGSVEVYHYVHHEMLTAFWEWFCPQLQNYQDCRTGLDPGISDLRPMLVAAFLALLLCTSIDGGQEKFTQESCEGEQNELQVASAAAARLRVLVPWFFSAVKMLGFLV